MTRQAGGFSGYWGSVFLYIGLRLPKAPRANDSQRSGTQAE